MDIKDIAGSDIKQLLEYIEEQSSKDNADLYRYEFTHIVVTAANHPSLSVEEYKKLLATSSGSGRRWTYRRISFVDKIYDYVSMGILPMVQHKREGSAAGVYLFYIYAERAVSQNRLIVKDNRKLCGCGLVLLCLYGCSKCAILQEHYGATGCRLLQWCRW